MKKWGAGTCAAPRFYAMMKAEKEAFFMIKSRPMKILLAILAFWAVFVAAEGVRLVGSADPGKYPILTIYSIQTADEIADYHSLGFA